MRTTLTLLVLLLGGVLPAEALTLDLPVRRPGHRLSARAPAYAGDVFMLQLAPAAAARARTARASAATPDGTPRLATLQVAAIDRVAARLGGVWFEPQFRGETPPAPGSGEPDLTAFYVAHLPEGAQLEEALESFRGLGEVISADPIAILKVAATPNDSLFAGSHWLLQPGNRRDIHAPAAWDVTIGDTSIVVAVLDTGVLPYHPDLGGRVAGLPGQIWTNWLEAGGQPGVDDDLNGYVDDLHGWDFVHLGTAAVIDTAEGEDGRFEDNDPNDFASHGTSVAGLIGALTDNAIGLSGVAWRVRLMPLRMGWAYAGAGPQEAEVRMDFAARAIRYATLMGADVINASWESAFDPALSAAVGAAVRAGVTVINAAGNSTPFHYLGDRDDVIAIAATDADDIVAGFSNTGTFVDLSAPGVGQTSTWSIRAGTDSIGYRTPGYGPFGGTSGAAPLAAGTAALILAEHATHPGLRPLTPREIQLRLMETSDDIAAQNPTLAGLYGAGRLNAARAVTERTGSTASRTRSRSVGASVFIPSSGGVGGRVAFVTLNRRLVILDAVTQDTVAVATLSGAPTGGVAAADLGGGLGVGLFVSTFEGFVDGFDADGQPLAGWPQTGSTFADGVTPALGDLDFIINPPDGIEIVCGGTDGLLWAWHADGTPVDGFPVVAGSAPLTAVAISDLDSGPSVDAPAAEIVALAADGTCSVFGGNGLPLPGWPVATGAGPRAPIVVGAPSTAAPTIVVAAGNQLHAFTQTGVPLPGYPLTLDGPIAQDPSAGDVDGDGDDDLVLVTGSPPRLDVRDVSGASLAAWPRPLFAAAQGAAIMGEIETASPGNELLLMRGGGLLALDASGDSITVFAKPGGAGIEPTFAGTDADARLEVLAGTGGDSLYYIYDAGPGSSAAAVTSWPTARGNFARTGSRLYAPAIGALDATGPTAVTDLGPGRIGDSSIQILWSAPNDVPDGRAATYEVRRAGFPIDASNFASVILVPQSLVPATAGAPESLTVAGLAEGTTWYFAIRSRDAAGNPSPISNVLQVATSSIRPGMVADLRATTITDSSIVLVWTATGDDGLVGRPQVYAVRAAETPIDDDSYVTAPLQRVVSATVDAGGTETLVFRGLEGATRYWFALKAVDASGNISLLSNVLTAQTDVGGPLSGRRGIALAVLEQPSRSTAEFYWQAAADGEGSPQQIAVFDLFGRRLRVLELGTGAGGRLNWDGRDADGRRVPAGLYFARLLSGSLHVQTRLVLLP